MQELFIHNLKVGMLYPGQSKICIHVCARALVLKQANGTGPPEQPGLLNASLTRGAISQRDGRCGSSRARHPRHCVTAPFWIGGILSRPVSSRHTGARPRPASQVHRKTPTLRCILVATDLGNPRVRWSLKVVAPPREVPSIQPAVVVLTQPLNTNACRLRLAK